MAHGYCRLELADHITVKNPNGKQSGVSSIVLDGSPVEGTTIKATPGRHTVEVIM